jgi:hypothetical protein
LLAGSLGRLTGHGVLDNANDGGDDGAGHAASDRLTQQLANVDAADSKSQTSHVRFGSKADMTELICDVRFTPESRHCRRN